MTKGEKKKKLLGVELKVKKELDEYSDEALEELLISKWVCGC